MDGVDEDHLKKCRWVRVNWLWSKVGRVNLGIFLRFNPVVSLLSACIIWGFVAWCMVESDAANEEMGKWKIWITEKFTWMYIGTQDIWAVIILMLYFSKYSNMKLGKDDEEPEFNDATYFTMLFAAGIGIGLFYFGVGKLVVKHHCLSYLMLFCSSFLVLTVQIKYKSTSLKFGLLTRSITRTFEIFD